MGESTRGESTHADTGGGEDVGASDSERLWGEFRLADSRALPGLYTLGGAGQVMARRDPKLPGWLHDLDPVETLFLGAAWPVHYGNPYRFANACAAWLGLLRGTAARRGILRFAGEALEAAAELRVPVTSRRLAGTLEARLDDALRGEPEVPPGLLPGEVLRGARCTDGPPRDIPLPREHPAARKLRTVFWSAAELADARPEGFSFLDDTSWGAAGAMMDGLRLIRHRARRPARPASLLAGLYAGLVAARAPDGRRQDLLTDLGPRTAAWAMALPADSPLVPVTDALYTAAGRELDADETLGRLFSLPAFTGPVSGPDREWRSEPRTALSRIARELPL